MKLWKAVIGLGVLGGAVYLWRKPKAPKIPSPAEAVRKAISILGTHEDAGEIADVAYTMAYPGCPPKLDPKDPTHATCIQRWLELRDLALAQVVEAEKARPKRTPPKDGAPAPAPAAGPAKDMADWINGLTPAQRTGLREIIGPKYFDPIRTAADQKDDGATVSAVLRFKRAVEQHAADDPVEAFKEYQKLKALLGPKLDELMRTAQKYK